MAGVDCNDVRNVLGLISVNMLDSKVKMIKRAEVTLEVEISKSIDYANRSEVQKEVITRSNRTVIDKSQLENHPS